MPLEVLYEDNHLIAVHKPHRILVQGDLTGDTNLLDIVKEYLKVKYGKPGNVYLGLVHRLDRPVAGVIVFAKTSKAAARLSESIRSKEVKKIYWARVEGNVPIEGHLVHHLKSQESGPVEIQEKAFPESKKAELKYRKLSDSLVEIELITGRKHQIRAQFAFTGHPIVGDSRYGSITEFKKGAIALLAKSLEFKHPVREAVIKIETKEIL